MGIRLYPSSIFPPVETKNTTDFLWKIETNIYIQSAVGKIEDSAIFYTRFRDYDDFISHSQRPAYFSFDLQKRMANGWKIVVSQKANPNWQQTNDSYRFPKSFKDLDTHSNDKGFLQKTSDNFNIKFGRDNLVWDVTRTGLLLSNNLPTFDHFRFDTWGKTWKYHFFFGDISTRNILSQQPKNLLGNRLQYHPTEQDVLIISSLMVVAKNLSFSERNPFLWIGHNLERGHYTHNMMLSLEYRKKTIKEGWLFCNFVLDEISNSSFENYTSAPTAFGFQAGFTSNALHIVTTKTSKWLYNHTGKTTDNETVFVVTESQDIGKDGDIYFDRFIGFPMGCGVFTIDLGFEISNFVIDYRFVQRSPNLILETMNNEYQDQSQETRNRLGLQTSKRLSSKTSFFLSASVEQIDNYHHKGIDQMLFNVLIGFRFTQISK